MTALRFHHSNRMEALAADLAHLMRADPGDPFAPERIVVPHPTIGRWLSLELARELGIAANIRFEQPAEFAWSIMRDVMPDLAREQPYEPARLRWRIHDLLPEPAGETGRRTAGTDPVSASPRPTDSGGAARVLESAVGAYLRDGDRRKRFELADRLARMYDQCLLYRPDWIRAWENEGAPHWQARLWQHLIGMDGPHGARHWVGALERFRRIVRGGSRVSTAHDPPAAQSPAAPLRGPPSPRSPHPPVPALPADTDSFGPPNWPRRASFFAVPALSPSYLELLFEAARGIEVHLFLLNPCREYWGDIHTRREMDHRAGGADPDSGYFTEGNELLAAWGRAGRDMIDALVEAPDAEWDDRFVMPAGAHRLAAIQRDILDLRLASEAARHDASLAAPHGRGTPLAAALPRASGGATPERPPSAPNLDGTRSPPAPDDSIQIHVCHSPVREAEVLHDRLLALFDAHHDLEPADVLVLTPELEVYGPAIEAVFAAAGLVPCNVARAQAVESRTLRAFLDLLALAGSRYAAEAVLAPLAAPAVRVRFGIGGADLPAIRGAVREAGIRWGVDEAHRVAQGLPETAEHTWRQGLRRLLLGYAMSHASAPISGLVPCPAADEGIGGATIGGELLGRFASYCEEVFELRRRLEGARRPARWGRVLRDVAEVFLADGSSASGDWALARGLAAEAGAVRALIRDFEREAAHAQARVPIEVVLDVLRERGRETGRGTARLADGVTVASLGSRGIYPAEVVCLAGMNDGVFPRSPSTPSFDVLAAGPARRGDRDIRYEDRHAFLEALLAARRCFLVTHAGRGLRDDAPIPPCVLVDELKDYLGRRFPATEFETRHPLQPFSPRYFASRAPQPPAAAPGTAPGGPSGEEGPVSYSRGMCEAAKTMLTGMARGERLNRFAGAALPEPDESLRSVDLAELADFFANPTRFLLRERLGVRLELDDLTLDADEPFELDGLERYRLRADVWNQIRAGVEPERSAILLQGSGRLPQAELGRIVLERARSEVEPLGELLAPWRPALDSAPRAVNFDIDGFRVVGAFRNVSHAVADGGESVAAGADEGGTGVTKTAGMLWWRIGQLRARDRIEIWLRQLAWSAAGHGPLEATAIWLEKDSWRSSVFLPPEDAREQLGRWLRARWRGLAAPLPFFPESSFEFARSIVRSGDAGGHAPETARETARNAWFGGRHRRAERLDLYFNLVHDEVDPLNGEFEDLAMELLVALAGAQR